MDNYSASKTHFPGRINQIKNALHFRKGSGSAAALPASQKLLALTIVSQSALALVKGRLSTSVDQRCTVLCALFTQDPAAWNIQQRVRLSHPTEDFDFLVNGRDRNKMTLWMLRNELRDLTPASSLGLVAGKKMGTRKNQ